MHPSHCIGWKGANNINNKRKKKFTQKTILFSIFTVTRWASNVLGYVLRQFLDIGMQNVQVSNFKLNQSMARKEGIHSIHSTVKRVCWLFGWYSFDSRSIWISHRPRNIYFFHVTASMCRKWNARKFPHLLRSVDILLFFFSCLVRSRFAVFSKNLCDFVIKKHFDTRVE